jgi:DNA-binding CsgD family transcriptional regulator
VTYRPESLRDRVRALLQAEGYDLSPREIAARLGCDPESARFTKYDIRRHAGKSLPGPEVFKRRRAAAKRRAVPVLGLIAEGKTFSEIASELGVSLGQVAGMVFRARRHASLAESRDRA